VGRLARTRPRSPHASWCSKRGDELIPNRGHSRYMFVPRCPGGFYKRGCQAKNTFPFAGGFVFLGIQPLSAAPTLSVSR